MQTQAGASHARGSEASLLPGDPHRLTQPPDLTQRPLEVQ